MIKLLVTDCDGVLTDGKIPRRFSIFDGDIPEGIKVIILTAAKEISDIKKRADSLGLQVIQVTSAGGKYEELHNICKENELSILEAAYIGDDLADVECLRYAGFSMAPRDARRSARKAAGKVLRTNGGDGVLREAFKIIKRRSRRCE